MIEGTERAPTAHAKAANRRLADAWEPIISRTKALLDEHKAEIARKRQELADYMGVDLRELDND